MRDGQRRQLAFEPPYAWPSMAAFLAARATPGVEEVHANRYRRTIEMDGRAGTIEVRLRPTRPALELRTGGVCASAMPRVVARVRRLFDLDASPATIGRHLSGDSMLADLWRAHPGIRVPGAWDGFELAVRAVLGQQVTVRAATTLAGRIAAAFGSPVTFDGPLSRLFPTAVQLADAPLERLGVMPARATAIRGLARAVVGGRLGFHALQGGAGAARALMPLPGIGPWTAGYVAMRAGCDADAMPAGDLVLRQATGASTARRLEALSQTWRPWRAYAVMLLWHAASRPAAPVPPTTLRSGSCNSRPRRKRA